ncbi:MAG: SAM-dependent methyltransferase [Symploca sp. SIO2B6]|nr:SAM-dependent methyltransferase [Symploca sp. SIO2B6]
MGLKLNDIVPWGRSLDEYIAMFQLSERDLARSMIDCAAGPASFNAEMTTQEGSVISCDPLYQFSRAAIQQRIAETKDVILAGVQANRDAYRWDSFHSPEHLCHVRLATMEQFLADFPTGQQTGRYQVAALPTLPYRDRQFDLALCGHFLFAYSDHLSFDFHWEAIQELCRIAHEVRIFPVVTLSGERSPFLKPILDNLKTRGKHTITLETVGYEFQKGGNQLLKIQCSSRAQNQIF